MKIRKQALAVLLALVMLVLPGLSEGEDVLVLNPEEELQFSDGVDAYLQEQKDRIGEMRHLLLVGLDARPGETTGRSDTMILVTLDPE